jgi:Natural resistance-associated macrophage protein
VSEHSVLSLCLLSDRNRPNHAGEPYRSSGHWSDGCRGQSPGRRLLKRPGQSRGPFAALLFSLGIVGTGLLALPVLGGSAAYGIGEAFKWPVGLERKAKEAKAFYSVLAVATLIGLAIDSTKLDPIGALVWAAIVNGITADPVMFFKMLLASWRKVMGKLTLPLYLKTLVHRLAYNSDVVRQAPDQLAVFQGASEAPISELILLTSGK